MISTKGRKCFIIMPFGKRDGVDFDRVFNDFIRPVAESDELGLTTEREDQEQRGGSISHSIIQKLISAPVVIADITTWNANVFYELGVRHALKKKITILIRDKSHSFGVEGNPIPFDIAGLRVMFYDIQDEHALTRSKNELHGRIIAGIDESTTDSLVYNAIPGLEVRQRSAPLKFRDEFDAELEAIGDRRISVITGDIVNVDKIDLWVNPENTKLEMARFHDPSISAHIRYFGAERDARGHIIRDVIAEELRKVQGRAADVEPGSVVVTPSGALERTNNVKRILHVAAMHGQPGKGYRPISNFSECITNCLRCADDLNVKRRMRKRYTSILFSLFGTKSSGEDPQYVTDSLFGAAYAYLLNNPQCTVKRIAFLAYLERDLELCESALKALQKEEKRRLHQAYQS